MITQYDVEKLFEDKLVDGALCIDNTTLTSFLKCPRSYFFYSLLNRKANKSQAALNFGAAMHEGLAAWYSTSDKDKAMQAITQKFDTFETEEYEYRNLSLALDVIDAYIHKYPSEHWTPIVEYIETSFAVPLGTVNYKQKPLPVIWTGKIDLCLETYDNKLWLMDHKTTSIMGASFFSPFILSLQMRGYVWALNQLVKKQCQGVVINALAVRKPTKTRPLNVDFERSWIEFTKEQIDSWTENTLQILQLLVNAIENRIFIQNTESCSGKYGLCQFFEVCSCDESLQEHVLYSDLYLSDEWSPLK